MTQLRDLRRDVHLRRGIRPLRDVERDAIIVALELESAIGVNKASIAQALGVSEKTLYKKIAKYGLHERFVRAYAKRTVAR